MGTKAVTGSLCGGQHSRCFYHPLAAFLFPQVDGLRGLWVKKIKHRFHFAHPPSVGGFNPINQVCLERLAYNWHFTFNIPQRVMWLPWWLRVKNLPSLQKTRVRSWVRKIPWRRKWQHTPVFLPGESHGQRRPLCHKESETTERLNISNKTNTEQGSVVFNRKYLYDEPG